ncbi:MAG TPA: SprT-like domain-containing protein [Gemmatimonadaceae bacterium]|nr:SprT-like domain-containing protein [Gemmatimonadaceae bacterium]
MLSALTHLLRRRAHPQLELPLDRTPRTAVELLERLRAHGLPTRIERCRLTRNRTVMVSFSGPELRIHEGYLGAPPVVLEAVAAFVRARTRAERARARAVIVGHQIERAAPVRRPPRTAPEDEALARELAAWHGEYNRRFFAGALRPVAVRISRRMRTRLGHYTAAGPTGEPAEIAISRTHLRRHGWEEALHTLLHEMVHQWQDEAGHPIDHGATFRAKAREVGITPSARRTVVPHGARGDSPKRSAPVSIGLRAARQD